MARGMETYQIVKDTPLNTNNVPEPMNGYPFVWLHWKVHGDFVIDVRYEGREGCFPFRVSGSNVSGAMESIKYLFKYYVPKE